MIRSIASLGHAGRATLRAARVRITVLSITMAASLVVFGFVAQLSTASVVGLENAVTAEEGRQGTYIITSTQPRGIDVHALEDAVASVARSLGVSSLTRGTVYPSVPTGCGLDDGLGEQTIAVRQSLFGGSLAERDARLPQHAVCVGGVAIPEGSVRIASEVESRQWGATVMIDLAFRDLLGSQSDSARSTVWILVTDEAADYATELRFKLSAEIAEASMRAGVEPESVYIVDRSDFGAELRAATQGTERVYSFIAWAVLCLGAIGVTVVQTISTRHRAWFFALCSALGAKRARLGFFVLAETAFILAGATLLTLFSLWALSGPVERFATSTFSITIDLLDPQQMLGMLTAAVVVLALSAVLPLITAVRQDPLDILEAPPN